MTENTTYYAEIYTLSRAVVYFSDLAHPQFKYFRDIGCWLNGSKSCSYLAVNIGCEIVE